MATELCSVVLAAGKGTRLRPLTETVPKALCPIGNVPLLDLALERLLRIGIVGPARVAVNAWYLAGQVAAAVGDRAHVSVESGPQPLGTAGGLGALKDWIDGRDVLVGNADAYLAGDDLGGLLAGWDGTDIRLLGTPGPPHEFGRYRFAGYSLLPWHRVRDLDATPAELVRPLWRTAEAAGELTVVPYRGRYVDTGTPGDYLAANLDAAGPAGRIVAPDAEVTGDVRHAVVGPGAVVHGRVERAVVWPGGYVGPDEYLIGAIRYGRDGTVTAAPDEGASE